MSPWPFLDIFCLLLFNHYTFSGSLLKKLFIKNLADPISVWLKRYNASKQVIDTSLLFSLINLYPEIYDSRMKHSSISGQRQPNLLVS